MNPADSFLRYMDFRIENLVYVRKRFDEMANGKSQIVDENDKYTFIYRMYFALDNLALVVDVLRYLEIGLPAKIKTLKQKVITSADLTKILDEIEIEDKVLQDNVRYFFNKKRGFKLDWNIKNVK